MRLKRISNKKETKDRKLDIKRSHEGLISRFSGGLSFDFYPKDTNMCVKYAYYTVHNVNVLSTMNWIFLNFFYRL